MARSGASWRYVLGWWAGIAGLAAVLALVGIALFREDGLQIAANVAQVVGIPLLFPTLLVPLLLWRRRAVAARAVTSADVTQVKDILAGLVAEQWRVEANLRSLDDPDPMPVLWRTTRDKKLIDHPANLVPASGRLNVSSSDVAGLTAKFRAMRRRRLVVLGGPGTGKTTLAVQLLRDLLATRDQHPDEPVPVLMSVADWDTEVHPDLHDWLAVRLAQDYPALRTPDLGPDMPLTLAARGHILPVLDGLDEMPPPAQAAIITALNRSLGDGQLILTSRTTEYATATADAGDVLTSALVIEPQPLTGAAAATYLERCLPQQPGPAWQQILTGLRAAPGRRAGSASSMAEIAATPLGLWLLRTVYITSRADPAPLLDPGRFPDTAALRAHLLDQLVPALIGARRPSDDPADPFRPRHRHDPGQVRRWLAYLAHTMSHPPAGGEPIRDFAWWRLAHITGSFTVTTRSAFALVVALAVALVTTVAVGLTIGLAIGLADELEVGLSAGLAVGLVAGLAVGLTAGLVTGLVSVFSSRRWSTEEPAFADLRLHGQGTVLIRILAVWFAVGFAAVYIARRIAAGYEDALAAGLAFGLTVVLIAPVLAVGLAAALTKWVEVPARADRATTPVTSWRADRALHLVRISVLGLAAGLVYGLMAAITAGVTAGLAVGLTTWLVSGLVAGIAFGHHHAWLAYLMATHRLAWAGRLPRKLVPFLQDAHRLGLLRAVGPHYQFRHAELHDHLAETYLTQRALQRDVNT
ncbi:NACHT domain-containing protein [Nonomuraea terrae]|uniref:NACHT domain-containing protein n=1 Tax=Nonomuraea terrae TaxID=2530383 RepID=UPI00378B332F